MKKLLIFTIAALSCCAFAAEEIWVAEYLSCRHNDGCQYFKRGIGKLTSDLTAGEKDCAICGGAVRKKPGKYEGPTDSSASAQVTNDPESARKTEEAKQEEQRRNAVAKKAAAKKAAARKAPARKTPAKKTTTPKKTDKKTVNVTPAANKK